MRCPEFNDRLHQLLDERRSPEADAALGTHAANCPECHAALRAQAALFVGLASLKTPVLPADFAERVARAATVPVTVRGPTHPTRWAWVAVAGISLAAAAVLSLSPAWRLGGSHQTPPPVAKEQDSGAKGAMSGLAVNVPGSKQDDRVRPAIEGPPAIAASEGQEGNLQYERQFRQWVQTLPETVERLEEVDLLFMEEYAPGLKSLRASFALALDTLRRSLPLHREMPKSQGAQRWLPSPTPA